MLLKFRPRQLTLYLSVALLVKSSQGHAQEDQADYRKEWYREDDYRMSITTDSAFFDIGLGSHVRLNGEFVIDAISGATPTGAPPPNQWRFLTFAENVNTIYQQYYNDPNNLILYQSGVFTSYSDYTNYIVSAFPQIGSQATNYAKQVQAALAAHANYNSSKVPLTDLNDLRRAFSLNVPITFGIHQITPQVSASEEHDYHSYGFALNYAVQLNKKNTTLNVGWSHTADRVRDQNEADGNGFPVWKKKISDDFLIGINQLITPKSYLTVDFTYGQEYGYLDDPYRGIMTLFPNPQTNPDDAELQPEHRPAFRTKEIFYTSYTQFIDPMYGSAEVGYRFFHDSFGIFAHTAEVAWHQKLGRYVVFTPAFRYYRQSAAYFYAPIFMDANNLPPYYSSDYRLSELESLNMSASFNIRVQKHFSIDLSYSRYVMLGLDTVTSPSAYPSANVYTVGGRILF